MKIGTNEIILRQADQWLHFQNPQQIISVDHPDAVIPALQTIEQQVNENGLHAAGFLSYEAAPAFDPALRVIPAPGFPLLWFGLYPPPAPISLPPAPPGISPLPWTPDVSRKDYDHAIQAIKDQIARGKTYQVNYTMRLRSDFYDDPWNFFLTLIGSQPNARYAAYVDTGRYIICSASPELFFRLDGNSLTCRPMKGTAKRGRTNTEDQTLSDWLRASEKNRAENVMIVDMIRNDLGRVAEVGTVKVPELFTTERYPTLWQMTSTVTAQSARSLTDILSALFPCASITGAPKVSTMEIIARTEKSPRKIYTGSIGHIAPGRLAQFNVTIRSLLIDRKIKSAEYGVGSGIVWDSTRKDEYEEALLKARVLTQRSPDFSLLETLLWEPEKGYLLREYHFKRLIDSAGYFDIPIDAQKVDTTLNTLAASFAQTQRVRLLIHRDGSVDAESKPFSQPENPPTLKVQLAKTPLDTSDIFLFHKTTHRAVYENTLKQHPGLDDVLLWNEHSELTEFTIGNLVLEQDGQLVTPPISCGLLAGTFRAWLLETGQIKEQILRVEDLSRCTAIYLVNSVRKWRQVELINRPLPSR